MNKRIETKYLLLDQKLLKVQGDNLNFDNKKIAIFEIAKPTGEYSPGVSGQIALDSNSFYVCVSGNGVGNGKWKFIPLTNWNFQEVPVG